MQTYDLIIVGGGPAGATAALYAQRHGLAALLLDKQCFPRDKICGDALSGKTVGLRRCATCLGRLLPALSSAAQTRLLRPLT
ncbi:MAG: NAD(P)-binding protein [Candidatus Latescibacteria bacterium]|nr:NAD(P)-binding protein [Candidatus Latescibacterota bacterium]